MRLTFVSSPMEPVSQKDTISLDFLDANTNYHVVIYKDGDGADYLSNPYPMTILQQDVTSRDVLPVHLAPGGGFAIRIDKRD